MLWLEADRLPDGTCDRPQEPGVLGIEGERIAVVGESRPGAGRAGGVPGDAPQRPVRPGDVALSLGGCTLLPGLIDFHSHIGIDTRRADLGAQVRVAPPQYLAGGIAHVQEDLRAGVTTLRLCGDLHGADLVLRREIQEGRVGGPRLVVAGRALRSPRGSGGAVASGLTDDPEAISRAVQENLDAGVDFVKLFVSAGVGDPSRDPTECYY